jgi:hypothetical protein
MAVRSAMGRRWSSLAASTPTTARLTETPLQEQHLGALSLQDESWANTSLGCWLDVAIASPLLSALQIGEDGCALFFTQLPPI